MSSTEMKKRKKERKKERSRKLKLWWRCFLLVMLLQNWYRFTRTMGKKFREWSRDIATFYIIISPILRFYCSSF